MTPEQEFIVGPQVPTGSEPIAVWFDKNAIDRGLTLCAAFPDEAHTPGNILISGTVSVTKDSKTVTGVGTRFLTEVKDYVIVGPKGARTVKIKASVESDTSLTLTQPWTKESVSGQPLSSPTGQDMDNYQGYLNYYDFALTQYTNHYRTGDQRLLDCARKVTDSWWSQPVIDYGENFAFEGGEGLAPRSIALGGLILRALDGRPEMWPWITRYVDNQYGLWVEQRITYPGFYFGIRDGGFMLLYCAILGAAHPDLTTRETFKNRALNGAVNYYARLQGPDGSYRWNDDDFPFSGTEQPFMVGILNETMVAVHKLTGNLTVKNAIIKSAEHEYNFSYSKTWRAMYYFVHGTIGNNPVVSCETGCGNASNPYPPTDTSQITEARQLNATAIHVFGYAYKLTNDPKFKTWGDEMFAATYSGADGYRALAHYRGKEYDECYRAGGKYLGYRAGQWGTTPPSPMPDPAPGPIPAPPGGPTPTPPPTTPTQPGTPGTTLFISGKVLKDGAGLAGQKVTLTDVNGDAVGINTTGSTGSYQFEINPGQKGMVQGPSGFNPASYTFDGSGSLADKNFVSGTVTPTPPPPPTPDPTPPTPPPPTPTPEPPPSPPPITSCVISGPDSISVAKNGSGVININVSNVSGSVTVTHAGSDGQVQVTPASRTATASSNILPFQVKVKKQGRMITFNSPCGSKSVKVNVQ